MRNVQRERRDVIIKFPGETIGETRKSPLAHPQGKVLPLNIAGRNVLFGGA
jgi:hypothetical protein